MRSMKKTILLFSLLSSSNFAASVNASSINSDLLSRLKTNGLSCVMTSYRKRVRTGLKTEDTGKVQTNANLSTYNDADKSILLQVEGEHSEKIGWFNIGFEELRTLTDSRLLFHTNDGFTRTLDIDLESGEGNFIVKATMGGWPINERSHHRQEVKLENCTLN